MDLELRQEENPRQEKELRQEKKLRAVAGSRVGTESQSSGMKRNKELWTEDKTEPGEGAKAEPRAESRNSEQGHWGGSVNKSSNREHKLRERTENWGVGRRKNLTEAKAVGKELKTEMKLRQKHLQRAETESWNCDRNTSSEEELRAKAKAEAGALTKS